MPKTILGHPIEPPEVTFLRQLHRHWFNLQPECHVVGDEFNIPESKCRNNQHGTDYHADQLRGTAAERLGYRRYSQFRRDR